MKMNRISNDLLSKSFTAIQDRLEVVGPVTIATLAQRLQFVAPSTANQVARYILGWLVSIGAASIVKRGVWNIDEPIKKSKVLKCNDAADLAAKKLREEKPINFEKRALEIAEEYGVSVLSLVIALRKPRPIRRHTDEPATVRQDNSYKFKTNFDDID
jgi:hypothetical protein